MIDYSMEGGPRLNVMFDHMEADVAEVAAKSLLASFEGVMAESKDEYCPVDTGYLRSTGYVKLDEWAGMVAIEAGYSAEYAAPVHEINKNYKNGKQWKYWETPLKANLPDIQANLMYDLQAWLTRGV